jgi:pimeloyl-ACP methyl ester carboxylesterase
MGAMTHRTVTSQGTRLALEEAGEGRPVVLLHGLTATRRYVVMGSRTLERSGHRVLAYDARGHGASSPAPGPEAYRYPELVADLLAVLDEADLDRAVLAGASMGAHTALALALEHPERVAGLVVITPAYDPDEQGEPESLARWDALSDGLRDGGVEGFLAAYGEPSVPEGWRETVTKVIRQRLAEHEHPRAVADALRAVPRSRPFAGIDELAAIDAPAAIVASRDDADPGHPLAVGGAYAKTIPGARLHTEDPGQSPLAWQGTRLSKIIAQVAEEAQ